uniref:Di19 zinc-binding domain-containing protein n=1 Tax=Aegilops tauschii subsp. strangulata TaxID=200361 RepID=A0A453JZG0_AEGTS
CPFCGEEFDGVGLCLHIEDEHAAETKAGVCPICTDRVGMDLVGHMTSEHPSFFKVSLVSTSIIIHQSVIIYN